MGKARTFLIRSALFLVVPFLMVLTVLPRNEYSSFFSNRHDLYSVYCTLAMVQIVLIVSHKIFFAYVFTSIVSGVVASVIAIVILSVFYDGQVAAGLLAMTPLCIVWSFSIGAFFKWARLAKYY